MESREEAKGEAKKLWKAGAGRNEIARRTLIPRSTITRWSKVWETQEQPEKVLDPVAQEEERLRSLAMGNQEQIPSFVHIANEEEREQYLFLLEQAGGDYGRIAREYSGGPFKLLPGPLPEIDQALARRIVFGRGSLEDKRRRLGRLKIEKLAQLYGATHPPGFGGE